MEVILYTTECPNCKILKKMLDIKNITYSTVTDLNLMIEKGFQSLPQLEADNVLMDYNSAKVWVAKYNDNV